MLQRRGRQIRAPFGGSNSAKTRSRVVGLGFRVLGFRETRIRPSSWVLGCSKHDTLNPRPYTLNSSNDGATKN